MKPTRNLKTPSAITRTKKHYENFTVGSFVLPKDIGNAIVTLYAFARLGDDIADEGNAPKRKRLKDIEYLKTYVKKIQFNQAIDDPYFKILQEIYIKYSININNLYKFIKAFNEDINHAGYKKFNDLMGYCDKAANPAGELILSLISQDTKANIKRSNAICSSLALINFAQGAVEDFQKGRIYFPRNEMKTFDLRTKDIKEKNFTVKWIKYKKFWVDRNEKILHQGMGLGSQIKGMLGIEITMITLAAALLLKKMKHNDCNLFKNPPKVNSFDWFFLFIQALFLKLTSSKIATNTRGIDLNSAMSKNLNNEQ